MAANANEVGVEKVGMKKQVETIFVKPLPSINPQKSFAFPTKLSCCFLLESKEALKIDHL